MSVFDDLEQKATGQERRDSLWEPPLNVSFSQRETGKIDPMGFATRKEYVLSVTLASRFWANQAQLQQAREVAERSLATLLYHDVLAKLSQIEHAVINGDGKEAYQACGEMRSMLTR